MRLSPSVETLLRGLIDEARFLIEGNRTWVTLGKSLLILSVHGAHRVIRITVFLGESLQHVIPSPLPKLTVSLGLAQG
jgi:hypothetical protein